MYAIWGITIASTIGACIAFGLSFSHSVGDGLPQLLVQSLLCIPHGYGRVILDIIDWNRERTTNDDRSVTPDRYMPATPHSYRSVTPESVVFSIPDQASEDELALERHKRQCDAA